MASELKREVLNKKAGTNNGCLVSMRNKKRADYVLQFRNVSSDFWSFMREAYLGDTTAQCIVSRLFIQASIWEEFINI